MPNVNDIANLAEALEKQAIITVGDRCVAVRNRNATCRACVNACPFGALDVAANELTFNNTLCENCGACVGACPTEALVFSAAPDTAIIEEAARALGQADGVSVIACARISSKRLADPDKYAEVPCLARIDESIVLALAARGAREVVLVDGNCATCKYRACTARLDETVREVDALISCSGSAIPVRRDSAFPDELLVEDTTGLFGSTRRGFFSEAVGAARETAMTAARTTLEQELGMKAAEISIGERLRVTASGTLPTISVPRHDRLLNSFDALGEPAGSYLESRRFATIAIDTQRCNSCGMCAVFCPTGALSRNPADKPSDPIEYFEFSAAECIHCNVCKDVCWKGALEISKGVAIDQLYDFEPIRFDVPRAKKTGFFGAQSY